MAFFINLLVVLSDCHKLQFRFGTGVDQQDLLWGVGEGVVIDLWSLFRVRLLTNCVIARENYSNKALICSLA
jgi:hypothetical protein